MIHIYCGDGKGKTTASIGLAAACAGLCGTQFELDEPVYGHPDGGCD